jgi:antitoxin component of RelBE/YafQ-DinJ toxin-antitoxin module
MDAKVTLSFDAAVIKKAKQYAEDQGISLSRLTEILLRKLTSGGYISIEEFPVADWVSTLSEGEATYITRPKSITQLKKEYHQSRKK